MSGYHTKIIEKGILGEFSKIEEEFLEAKDALENGNTLMLLLELSDLIGAIEYHAMKYNITLDELIIMKNKTSEVFLKGYRT